MGNKYSLFYLHAPFQISKKTCFHHIKMNSITIIIHRLWMAYISNMWNNVLNLHASHCHRNNDSKTSINTMLIKRNEEEVTNQIDDHFDKLKWKTLEIRFELFSSFWSWVWKGTPKAKSTLLFLNSTHNDFQLYLIMIYFTLDPRLPYERGSHSLGYSTVPCVHKSVSFNKAWLRTLATG